MNFPDSIDVTSYNNPPIDNNTIQSRDFISPTQDFPGSVHIECPPDSPHFYLFIGESVHRHARAEDSNLQGHSLKSNIQSAIQEKYQTAHVLEGAEVGGWKFFLVENEGRLNVFFQGTTQWLGQQGALNIIEHFNIEDISLYGVHPEIGTVIPPSADFRGLEATLPERGVRSEPFRYVDEMGEIIRGWEENYRTPITAIFGYSGSTKYSSQIQVSNPDVWRIGLNGEVVYTGQYCINFARPGDILTNLNGTYQSCFIIPERCEIASPQARLMFIEENRKTSVNAHFIEGVSEDIEAFSWQDWMPQLAPSRSESAVFNYWHNTAEPINFENFRSQEQENSSHSTNNNESGEKEEGAPSTPTEGIYVDRGFSVGARSSHDKPKPKAFDIENLQVHLGMTSDGKFESGVTVPVNIGGLGMNAGVYVQIDQETIKDVCTVLTGGKLGEKKITVDTGHGCYEISWYKMGHSLLSSSNDFKVVIKDADGKTHTRWIYGQENLEPKIKLYVTEIVKKKVEREVVAFSRAFKESIKNGNIDLAQQTLDVFYSQYKEQLPDGFKLPCQLTIDEAAAPARVMKLQDASIETIISRIQTCAISGVVSLAQYIEQGLLKQLLVERLLSSGTEKNFQECAPLTQVKKAEYINGNELEAAEFPSKEDFKRHHSHYRGEMRDRALASCSRILAAYREMLMAVREGSDINSSLGNLRDVYKEEKEKGVEGFGIRMVGNQTFGSWFEKTFPEVEQVVNDNSPWLKEYYAMKESAAPVISDTELRQLEILKSLDSLNRMFDSHIEELEGGREVLRIHQLTEKERLEMRSQAEAICKIEQKGTDIYKFAQKALGYNYQILADSYGKFSSQFLMNTFSEYAQRLETRIHKCLARGLTILHTLFPSILQDAIILPLGLVQGNGNVVLNNLRINAWKGLQPSLSLVSTAMPLFYDPQDKRYRSGYQNLFCLETFFSIVKSWQTGTFMLQYLPMLPFNLLEFVTTNPAEIEGEKTWIDRGEQAMHSALVKVLPSSLKLCPGNLPENMLYLLFKQTIANICGTAATILTARRITGRQGDNRDIKIGIAFVGAMLTMQYYLGFFEAKLCRNMYLNADFHLKNGAYEKALSSVKRLQEKLERLKYRETEFKFIHYKCFALETRLKCEYNIALNLLKENRISEAHPLIKQLKKAVREKTPQSLKDLCEKFNIVSIEKLALVAGTVEKLKKIQDEAEILIAQYNEKVKSIYLMYYEE